MLEQPLINPTKPAKPKKTPSIVHTRLTRLWSQYHVLRLCQGAIWFPLPREACNLQSGLPEPHLDFPWSQDSCSTKTFCFTATKNKRTSDLELRGCSSTLTSLLGPLRLLTTGTSVLELLNFPKAFPSCHLVELLHSSLGEYYHYLEDEENKALALSCPQL